jgi:ankyrin repeat protein
MAQWMIDNGSDIHQGGDGPLMRAALVDERIPMMELLVRNGANVNAEWGGHFPIVYAPCETVEPQALKWLLDHGADPSCEGLSRPYLDSALDYVIGTYSRSPNLALCTDILTDRGCRSRRDRPAVVDLLRGRIDLFAQRLDADPSLVTARFPDFDFGSSGARRLLLRGATLLHVAAEFGSIEAAQALLDRGADVNARAEIDASGVGGQTPIFHAATQFSDFGLAMVDFLLKHGASVAIRALIPGHYERPEEFVECSPVEYALLFPGPGSPTVGLLKEAQSEA